MNLARCATSIIGILALVSSVNAQQYQLKNGRRFAFQDVKQSNGSFVVSIPSTVGLETYTFALKDISLVTFPNSAALRSAEMLFLQGKYDEAEAQALVAQQENEQYMLLPGSPWTKALELQLELAEATTKKSTDVKAMDKVDKIAPTDQELLKVRAAIIDATANEAGRKTLSEIVKSEINPSNKARAILRMAETYKLEGQLEAAVKTYLQVAAFYSTDTLLGLRSILSASDCLYQMQRKDDALKLLNDYLTDNPISLYQDIIESKKKMMQSK